MDLYTRTPIRFDGVVFKLLGTGTTFFDLRNLPCASLAYCDIYYYYISISDEVNFSIYLILPAALGPGVYSASNRNEYQ
jgi:hypothetical protein